MSDPNDPAARSKRGPLIVTVLVFVGIFVVAGVWGPAILRMAQYRYHESIDLADGRTVAFYVFRGDGGAHSTVREADGSFWGTTGGPPSVFPVPFGLEIRLFVFPGEELDHEEGREPFHSGKGTDEEWQRLIDRRAERYPEVDWEAVRDWVREMRKPREPREATVGEGSGTGGGR